jgi:hypothetical protein
VEAELVVVVDDDDGCKVSVTGMLAAGRPMVVSRTWHVIGGLAGGGVDIVFAVVVVVVVEVAVGRGGERWFVTAERRVVVVVVGFGIRCWKSD